MFIYKIHIILYIFINITEWSSRFNMRINGLRWWNYLWEIYGSNIVHFCCYLIFNGVSISSDHTRANIEREATSLTISDPSTTADRLLCFDSSVAFCLVIRRFNVFHGLCLLAKISCQSSSYKMSSITRSISSY